MLVGGETYDVRLTGEEDMDAVAIAPATPAAALDSPAAELPAPRATAGGKALLKAPMPGVILEVPRQAR